MHNQIHWRINSPSFHHCRLPIDSSSAWDLLQIHHNNIPVVYIVKFLLGLECCQGKNWQKNILIHCEYFFFKKKNLKLKLRHYCSWQALRAATLEILRAVSANHPWLRACAHGDVSKAYHTKLISSGSGRLPLVTVSRNRGLLVDFWRNSNMRRKRKGTEPACDVNYYAQ